jgi:hypothetical protein
MFKAFPVRTFAAISGDNYKLFSVVVFVLQIIEYGIFPLE